MKIWCGKTNGCKKQKKIDNKMYRSHSKVILRVEDERTNKNIIKVQYLKRINEQDLYCVKMKKIK